MMVELAASEPLVLAPAELGPMVIFLREYGEPLPRRDALIVALRIAVRNEGRVIFFEGTLEGLLSCVRPFSADART